MGEAKLNFSELKPSKPKKVGLEDPLPQPKTGQKQETRLFAPIYQLLETPVNNGGADETRTRDLRRDRPAF